MNKMRIKVIVTVTHLRRKIKNGQLQPLNKSVLSSYRLTTNCF